MVRMQIKLVQKYDCYISLPTQFTNSLVQLYQINKICKPIRLTTLDGRIMHFGYSGGQSQGINNEVEISVLFAQLNGLQDGELVNVDIANEVPIEPKIVLLAKNQQDYEIIALNRDRIINNLLNNISVLYNNIVFPVFFQAQQYVTLCYKNPNIQMQDFIMINPQAELIIEVEQTANQQQLNQQLQKQQPQQQDSISSSQIQQQIGDSSCEDIFKSMVVQNEPSLPTLTKLQFRTIKMQVPMEQPNIQFQQYLYISKELFSKYQLSEKDPYKIDIVRPIGVSKLKSFATFLHKYALYKIQMNKQNKNTESTQIQKANYPASNTILTFLKPNDSINDQNTLIYSNNLKFSHKFRNKIKVEIDLAFKFEDARYHRMQTFAEFLDKNSTLKVIFVPIIQKPVSPEKFYSELKKTIMLSEQAILYFNQIVCLCENYYLVKILDVIEQGKDCKLRMLCLRQIRSSKIPNIDELIPFKFILSNIHMYHLNNTENDILKINKLIKRQLMTATSIQKKISHGKIYEIFFLDQLIEIQKIIKNHCIFWLQNSQSQPVQENISNIKNYQQNVILLTARNKNGKSSMFGQLKKSFGLVNFEYIDLLWFQQHPNMGIDYAKHYIEEKIQLAYKRMPSIIFLDNIEELCKNIERIDFQQTQEILISNVISKYIRDKIKYYDQLFFIISSSSKDMANAILTCKKLLQLFLNSQFFLQQMILEFVKTEIELPLPDYQKRKKFFDYWYQSIKEYMLNTNSDELATKTDNFVIANFYQLYNNIIDKKILTECNQDSILNQIDQLANKSIKIQNNFPRFEHVGGLQQVKDVVKETFQLPIKYAFLFKNIPIKLPRGVLLYGPPGCGKTYLAQAASNEIGLNFTSVKGPEMLNKYIGASEQAVRDVFEKAYQIRPSIVFFDEFDAVVPRRNSGSSNVTDRIVNQFLCYLDGVASMDGVYILAATSRPDLIDPALLRPGRIDKHVYLAIPTEEERKEILKIYGKNLQLMEDITIDEIVQRTHNFTSADVVALIKELRIKMAHKYMENDKQNQGQNIDKSFKLSKEFFETFMQNYRPSLQEKDLKKYEVLYKKFAESKQVDINQQKTTLY